MKLITTSLLVLLGLLLGFLMFFFLPLILTAYLADWWQSITGTPRVCAGGALPEADGGEDADPLPHQEEQADHAQNPEHSFFVAWEKAERERLRQEHVDKWLDDLTSDRSTDA
jgi:hypothetical protein